MQLEALSSEVLWQTSHKGGPAIEGQLDRALPLCRSVVGSTGHNKTVDATFFLSWNGYGCIYIYIYIYVFKYLPLTESSSMVPLCHSNGLREMRK